MPAYIIADVDVTDPEGYTEYRDKIPALIAAHGGRYLARGGTTEVLEGGWKPSRTVIVEFPSFERAEQFYNSPEYQSIKKLRDGAANVQFILIEGS